MKYIENKLNANIVKLKDTNNNYTSDNVEGALEEINSKIKNIEDNGYDDTQIKQDIVNIKTEIGTEELTTTDQTIKGAVNEIDSQINAIVNVGDLGKNGDNVYIKDSNGNKIGNGITISSEFNNINDTTASTSTTYSSNKIESIKGDLNSQITTIENNMQNIGNPTDEQVKNAINEAIANGDIIAGGLTSTAQTLLINILRSAVFTSDQSANIALLQNELAKGNSGSGGSETTRYTITNTLNNATTNNNIALVDANSSYTAIIRENDGYTLDTITVTMGGTDITSTAVSGTTITITSVTGNVVITVTTTATSSSGGSIDLTNLFTVTGYYDCYAPDMTKKRGIDLYVGVEPILLDASKTYTLTSVYKADEIYCGGFVPEAHITSSTTNTDWGSIRKNNATTSEDVVINGTTYKKLTWVLIPKVNNPYIVFGKINDADVSLCSLTWN